MGNLKNIQNMEISYISLKHDIINCFYIPCLKESIIYKRAVGYFSSNVLLELTHGLSYFMKNNGKMKLLVSPRLEPKDYEAIKKGYKIRELIQNKIIDNFNLDLDFDQKESRFDLLAYMIAHNYLEIKVVALEDNNTTAMFHTKQGIFEDSAMNNIAFSGSANETYNAYKINHDSFDVYCSWKGEYEERQCILKNRQFDSVWEGTERGLITIPFPEVIKNKILSYRSDKTDFTEIDIKYLNNISLRKYGNQKIEMTFDFNKLWPHQKKAIDTRKSRNFCGIFDMATGSGKTFTGIGAIFKLYEEKKKLFVFVCCPYTHLVDQWCDELKKFNIDAIKCYGGTNYKIELRRLINNFKYGNSFGCAVITNSSFQKNELQEQIAGILDDTLLLVDEAHNFGATNISQTLKIQYPYRLALSATFERKNDEEGTSILKNFFGKECIIYKLEDAISQGFLTQYRYYPILVFLNDSEYDQYVKLSKELPKYMTDEGKYNEKGKRIAIKRARIIAGAEGKISALKLAIEKYKNESKIIVYCGAVKHFEGSDESDQDEIRQIDAVLDLLNNQLKIKSMKFTSEENYSERKEIINNFKENFIQSIVAIKCLDEGLNIPSIKTAFILASTTNPKEYIQRRGRVLRLSKGKEYAEIYDFITLPREFRSALINFKNINIEKELVKKELERIEEFRRLSLNASEFHDIIESIKSRYKLDMNE